jgi:hypothetical protein
MPGGSQTQPAPDLPAGRRAALVVAVTSYADPSLRQLRAPAGDAAAFTGLLADPEIGGFTVTSVNDGTAQQMRLAVEEFLSDRRPDDLLLVYLSCHGLVDLRRRLYFAAADTLKNRLAATGVEAHWLLGQLEDCRARQQVVILDCCFSGAFAHGAKGETDLALGERFLGHGRGRVVLTASRGTEYSFEGEPMPGSAMPGSVFTRALVAGIRSGAADADNDGLISVDDAYSFAFDEVRAGDAQQTPQRWLYGAEGTILLARSPAGVRVTPAPLPDGVRTGLDSPHPAIRLGAVSVLGEWLADDDPARVVAARNALRQVVDSDVPQVAAAAQSLLDGAPVAAEPTADAAAPRPGSAGGGRVRRRRLAYAAAAVAAVLATGAIAGALLIPDGTDPPDGGGSPGSNEFTATAPWRLVIRDEIQSNDQGCDVTLSDADTGGEKATIVDVYGEKAFQMPWSGSFRWEANDPGCVVIARAGAGEVTLPFAQECCMGDTGAFEAVGETTVEVRNFNGNSECHFSLHRVSDGQQVEFGDVQPGGGPWVFALAEPAQVYLADVYCGIRVSAG